MNIISLFIAFVLALYIANVINCAIICEIYEEAEIAKDYVFFMPVVVLVMFFYYLFGFDSDSKYTRLQSVVFYCALPSKNLAVAECFAAMCKEKNRQVVTKAEKNRKALPKFSFCVNFLENKMSNQYFVQ